MPIDDDAEIRRRVVGRLPLDADERDDRRREERDRGGEHDPDREREPERLRAELAGDRVLAGPCRPRDLGGRPVLEEVERREHGERRRRGAERGELRAAEVPDDRGVDEDVERLGGERAERRKREPEDLAVVRRAERAPARLACYDAARERRARRSTARSP